MKKIAIIYYSRSGNTESMARLIENGARTEPEVDIEVFSAGDFPVESMPEYDGFIVGSPVYYGSMAYQVKKVFDESVKFHGRLAGKVGAAFSSAANIGGGNETTILDILNAMLIHGMVVQGIEKGDHYGPVSIGAPDDRVEKQCHLLGERVARLVKKIG